jgi:hypothetical protein
MKFKIGKCNIRSLETRLVIDFLLLESLFIDRIFFSIICQNKIGRKKKKYSEIYSLFIFSYTKYFIQLLVGLMMIIAKYGKKKLRFDPATAIEKG